MRDWNSTELLENLFFSSIRIYSSNKKQDEHILSKRIVHRYAICLITYGTGVLSINEVTHIAREGDIFILSPGMIVEGTSQGLNPIYYSVIFFSYLLIKKHRKEWRMEQPYFPISGKHPISSQDHTIKDIIERILATGKNRHIHEKIDLKYQLHNLLTKLMAGTSSQESEPETPIGMEHALAFINENYTKELKIGQLAQIAGYSINHFTRTFKHLMKMTPTEYFLQQRIRKAKQLLFSPVKIKEVAQQVGYKDEHISVELLRKRPVSLLPYT
ncbi:AraC family transcriptional regulator [Paenibacillus qinlingensis]|uniref:AraC family transcriptional regulator n=1 Tax=Paenibacillus qinlingensis TaxID=1837343 RepID=UPI001566D00B|nr:AraC family transcriptional regulator [Paenibacillus qinlingensis]NQX60610.1 helix-turn-helix transcriptional regulator [Paenibacillus qinlingensis]